MKVKKSKLKLCLYCEEKPVSIFGRYDEDSNTCEECLEKSIKKMNDGRGNKYSFKLTEN